MDRKGEGCCLFKEVTGEKRGVLFWGLRVRIHDQNRRPSLVYARGTSTSLGCFGERPGAALAPH